MLQCQDVCREHACWEIVFRFLFVGVLLFGSFTPPLLHPPPHTPIPYRDDIDSSWGAHDAIVLSLLLPGLPKKKEKEKMFITVNRPHAHATPT